MLYFFPLDHISYPMLMHYQLFCILYWSKNVLNACNYFYIPGVIISDVMSYLDTILSGGMTRPILVAKMPGGQ